MVFELINQHFPKIPFISCTLTQILDYLHKYSFNPEEQNIKKKFSMMYPRWYHHDSMATRPHELAIPYATLKILFTSHKCFKFSMEIHQIGTTREPTAVL